MNKQTTERQQANLEILDILKEKVMENPDMRFGQLLYSTGILTSHFSEIAGKQVTNDIFYIESSEILNRLKNDNNSNGYIIEHGDSNIPAQFTNPIKVISVTEEMHNVEVEPYVKMVFLLANIADINDKDDLTTIIKTLSWKNIFVAGIAIGDSANIELPDSIPWFTVKSSYEADKIIKGISQIVGTKGIVDLDVPDVIQILKDSDGPYYAEATSKNGNLAEAVSEIINEINRNWHVWWEKDDLLISIDYNHVNGKEGLTMKEMEPISCLVSFCGEYANYRWGLAVDSSLTDGAIRVSLLAS